MQVIGGLEQAVLAGEFKRSIHMSEEDVSEDDLLATLLLAAQQVFETATGRPLTSRTVRFPFRAGMGLRHWLPVAPVSGLVGLEWRNAGIWSALDASGLSLEDGQSEPQVVFPAYVMSGLPDGAEMRLSAMVGFDVAPEVMRRAVILIASDWYESGIDPERRAPPPLAFGCHALIRQCRYRRPAVWGAH